MTRECPICGETMRLQTRQDTARVPGTAETHVRPIREWACPECSYFEEATEDDR